MSNRRSEITEAEDRNARTSSAHGGSMIDDVQQSRFRIYGAVLIMSLIPAIGVISFPYIEKWVLLFGISAGFMAFTALFFWSGAGRYSKVEPYGTAITIMSRVFVAAALKIFASFPYDESGLYYTEDPTRLRRYLFLRFLEKAAIIMPADLSPEGEVNNKWRLCSMEEVEYAKFTVRMVPMWTTFLCCGVVSSIGNTYFVEQGSHMDRKLGNWAVPSQILLAAFFLGKKLFSWLAGCMLDAFGRHGAVIGIAVSMMFAVLSCTAAAVVETERLKVMRRNGLVETPDEGIPMSAYWLFFQFFLLAGLDSFFESSIARLIESQVPDALIKFVRLFHTGVSGLGYMLGVLSVYVVGKVSAKVDKRGWIRDTINKSRLDRYYWFLAVVSFIYLLIVYILVAQYYRFKISDAVDDGVELDSNNDRDPI